MGYRSTTGPVVGGNWGRKEYILGWADDTTNGRTQVWRCNANT